MTLGVQNRQPTVYVGFDDGDEGGTMRPLLPANGASSTARYRAPVVQRPSPSFAAGVGSP